MSMTRPTGRPTRYSQEEDAIILSTANEAAEETNRLLREAGFEERSPNALKQRRHYLKHRVVATGTPNDAELTKALLRRKQLTGELARAEENFVRTRAELATLNAHIAELLERLKGELEL